MPVKFNVSTLALVLFSTCFTMDLFAEKSSQSNTSAETVKKATQKHFAQAQQKSFTGPEKYFTGEVKVQMLFPANDTAHYSGAYVTFEPGARTAWHSHPAGQHMLITSGTALTGTRDGQIIEVSEGDSVWCPPNVDHWHGAAGKKPMTHLVITGVKGGENVVWKDKVTDAQTRK